MERNLVKRGLNRLMLLPVVLSVLYGIVVMVQINRMLDADDLVRHSIEVLTVSSDAQRHIQFQESALRGYLLTHDSLFETQFGREDLLVDSLLQQIHTTTIDNWLQTARQDTIQQVYWQWEAWARRAFGQATSQRLDTNILLRAGEMESMRILFRRLNDEERRLYAVRRERFKTTSTWLTILIVTVSIVLGLVVGLYARRQTRRFVDRFSQAIDETSRSRDLLETTLLSIGDAIIVTGADQRITLMNRRAVELTGWPLNDAKERRISEIFQIVEEISRQPIESPVARAIRDRKTSMLANHAVLLSQTGVEYPVEDSAAPIHNSRHEVVGAVLVFRDITERREGERAADAREREFRTLIENAPDLIIRFQPDLTISYINPAVEAVLGITPQMLTGRHFKDAGLPADIYDPWEQEVKLVFATGRPATTELQYQSVRGVRTYHTRLVPQRGEREIENVIVILRDITDLKQTSEKLRESERRFRAYIENTPDAFFLLRAIRDAKTRAIVDFIIDEVNDPGAKLLEVASGSVGVRLREISTEERHARTLERYSKAIESGLPEEQDFQAPESSGALAGRWYRAKSVPIGDLVAITIGDVTDRVETSAALRRSEERYRRLVETASEGIFSTDAAGRFTYANPHIRMLAGYSTDEVTKYFFTELVAPEERDRVQRHFYRQYLSRTSQSHIEAPFVTKAGECIWLSVTASLLINARGEVEGFDCVATDISEQRRLASALERTERELAEIKH